MPDLKQRFAREVQVHGSWGLAQTLRPDELPDAGWDYGTNRAYLQQLVGYWLDTFDWRAQERLLNTFPQFTTDIDSIHLHYVYAKGQGPQPLPLQQPAALVEDIRAFFRPLRAEATTGTR